MKHHALGILAFASASLIFTGCSTVKKTYKDVKKDTGNFTGMKEKPGNPEALLQPLRQGDKVIVRTAFDVKPVKNDVTHGKIMQLLSPYNENVDIKYSLTTVSLEPKQYTVLHTLKYPETFYVLEGSGILRVNGKDYALRKNKLIYVPANQQQTVINNTKDNLTFLSIISPAYTPSIEKTLKKLKPLKKTNDGPGKDGLFSGKYNGETPMNMGKDKDPKIQTLTPKENTEPNIK